MTLSGDTSALTFDLSKVSSPEAAVRLQSLTFSLAERVCNLEKRLAGSVCGHLYPPLGTCFCRPSWH